MSVLSLVKIKRRYPLLSILIFDVPFNKRIVKEMIVSRGRTSDGSISLYVNLCQKVNVPFSENIRLREKRKLDDQFTQVLDK